MTKVDNEPVYLQVSGDTVTIFPHNSLAKQGTIAMGVALLALGIFYEYMIESFGFKQVVFFALFIVLLIVSGLGYMRNNTPLMIMDNEKMSFPREHPEPVAWEELDHINFKFNHMVLFPKNGEHFTIWVDHRWPFPCEAIRDMMIGKRRKADIHLPPEEIFFVSN